MPLDSGKTRLNDVNTYLKGINGILKGINGILKGGQKETDDKLKGINETLQEILKKVEIRYPNGVAQA